MICYYAKGKPKEHVSLDVSRAGDIERRLPRGRELNAMAARKQIRR
jgi:hypothetical protein